APAPGTPPAFWMHQIDHLADRRRIVVFEHPEVQGDGASRPAPTRSDEDRRRDVLGALDAAELPSAALVSWGLGAQLALDAVAAAPERWTHLALLAPLLSSSFARSMGLTGDDGVGSALGRLAVRATPLLAQARRRLGPRVDPVAWLRRARLASPTIEQEALEAAIDALGRSDGRGIALVLAALEAQRRGPSPESITTPALLLVGEADVVASGRLARRLARRLPFGESHLVPGATHLLPLEYPEYVSLAIERFVAGAR
ncbi:MAG: alpha/beta hydrolase, partial [Myxococcales bacterium]